MLKLINKTQSILLCLLFGCLLPRLAQAQLSVPKPQVRSIKIVVREIFDESNIGQLYRSINSLKIRTKEEVVRRELLLKEGDDFDEFLLRESERNLRALPFLRRVSIVPTYSGDFVDLLVSVQDTWTFYPFLTFNNGGGSDNKSAGIGEQNLLGYGKRVEALVSEDDEQRTVEGVVEDDRLFGTDKQLILGYFERSDGSRTVATVGRPFRSLVDLHAWSLNSDTFDWVQRMYEDGELNNVFRQEHEAFTTGYTWSEGEPQTLLHRFTLGYDYTRDHFKPATPKDYNEINVEPESVLQDPALVPQGRLFSGPLFSYQRLAADYFSINYIDRFERVEDFDLGDDFSISAQTAPQVLGSENNALLTKFYNAKGWRLGSGSFLRGELSGSTRLEKAGWSNNLMGLQLKYFNVLGPKNAGGLYLGKHTLASSFTLDSGNHMDKDFQFLLGAANGLRGYMDRAFDGNQRLVLNLEDRFHLAEDVLRLVSIGGAFFADIGSTSQGQFGDLFGDNLRQDIGFGLRLGLPRSSGGSVVRFDIAFPLQDGPDGRGKMQPLVLISTGQLFSGHLRSEATPTQAARVSSGFLP